MRENRTTGSMRRGGNGCSYRERYNKGKTMFVRLLLNYLKQRKTKKDVEWIIEYAKNHPVEKTESKHEDAEEDNDISIAFNLTDSIDCSMSDVTYTLSLEYKSKDWEGDDILLCTSSKDSIYIHPLTFLQHAISAECNYLKNQDEQFIKDIENTKWFKFTYLEDSRDYPSISIERDKVLIKCHYLCPVFYISVINDNIIMIVDQLFDEYMNEIPKIFTEISTDLFKNASAVYDKDDEMWLHVDA